MSCMTSNKQVAAFRRIVWAHYRACGRYTLPWRKTHEPYKILVSELMLQQTQVDRVVPFYRAFLRRFPTVRALAKAPLADVLEVWSGLGYNRRAKYLHDAARDIVASHRGVMPREYPSLRAIRGIGPYTANAVRVFAFNEPEVLIETNVRTAIIHHFFTRVRAVPDYEIEKIAAMAATQQDPRQWHSALFDYGAHLKVSGVRNNARSVHYTKQSRFEGSLRQARGKILRALANGENMGLRNPYMLRALEGLERDGLIEREKGSVRGGSALGRKWRLAR